MKHTKLSNKELKNIATFKTKIESFNEESITFPITSKDKITIENIIMHYKYPKQLKNSALKLYEYTDIDNLIFCASNLLDVIVNKKALFSKDSEGHTIRISAAYIPKNNIIFYQNKKDIYHEFIHMASRSPFSKLSGFKLYKSPTFHTTGLNEGYTEALSRRIYYNKNYDTQSYKLYVYVMLIFECLYDDYKEMERDYFTANFNNLKNTFLTYGTEEEFNTLITLLNRDTWLLNDEDQLEIINFIKNIIKRTSDTNKISKSEKLVEEFFESKIIKKRRNL